MEFDPIQTINIVIAILVAVYIRLLIKGRSKFIALRESILNDFLMSVGSLIGSNADQHIYLMTTPNKLQTMLMRAGNKLASAGHGEAGGELRSGMHGFLHGIQPKKSTYVVTAQSIQDMLDTINGMRPTRKTILTIKFLR